MANAGFGTSGFPGHVRSSQCHSRCSERRDFRRPRHRRLPRLRRPAGLLIGRFPLPDSSCRRAAPYILTIRSGHSRRIDPPAFSCVAIQFALSGFSSPAASLICAYQPGGLHKQKRRGFSSAPCVFSDRKIRRLPTSRWSALPRSSSEPAKRSGRGRPASSGGGLPDSPCSRC